MENKHTRDDLIQMQSLPLSAKILMTKRRIRDWYDYFDGIRKGRKKKWKRK